MPVDLGRPIPPIEEVAGGAVTVQQKTGKEAQPCAPARCWAYCFLPRKEGARKGHVVVASIWRDHEGQGKTNHLVGNETCREFERQQGIVSK